MMKIFETGQWIKNQKRLNKMWHINPYCFWCGRPTKLFHVHINRPVKDMATVDHVYTKNHPAREIFRKHCIPSPVVLSCYHCNYQRKDKTFEEFAKIKRIKEIDYTFMYY